MVAAKVAARKSLYQHQYPMKIHASTNQTSYTVKVDTYQDTEWRAFEGLHVASSVEPEARSSTFHGLQS